jgi:Mitochondrial biogenesis AIM24
VKQALKSDRSFHLKEEEQYMQYQILKEPTAILDIHLDNAETITAEAGAMVYMQGDIEIKTKNSCMQLCILRNLKIKEIANKEALPLKVIKLDVDDGLSPKNADLCLTNRRRKYHKSILIFSHDRSSSQCLVFHTTYFL